MSADSALSFSNAAQPVLSSRDQLIELLAPYVAVLEQFVKDKNTLLDVAKEKLGGPKVTDLASYLFSEVARGRVTDAINRKTDVVAVADDYDDAPRGWGMESFGDHSKEISRRVVVHDAAWLRRVKDEELLETGIEACAVIINRATHAVSIKRSSAYSPQPVSSPEMFRQELEEWWYRCSSPSYVCNKNIGNNLAPA